MRILIFQITRMGDTLQTSPLIRALRSAYPDAHITLMVREMAEVVARRNPFVDEVLIHTETKIVDDIFSGDSDRYLRAYREVDAIVQGIRERRFDVVYNCSHSVSSAMFLKATGVPKVIGAHYSDDWQFVLRGPWTNYFFTSVSQRLYNDINLCDSMLGLYDGPRGRCELALAVHDSDREKVDGLWAEYGIGAEDFVVAFQLGASDDNKRWAIAHFAALAQRLVHELGARIVLLGVDSEAGLGQEFEHYLPGVAAHLFGRTSIPEAAALLERVRFLVTNDTGTMHIAAAVRCRVILVSTGYVHFRETGPYGEGHCAIERLHQETRSGEWSPVATPVNEQVTPDQVWQALVAAVECDPQGPIPTIEAEPVFGDACPYLSRFAQDGFLAWYPMVRRAATDADLLRIAYRAMWIEHFGGHADEIAETKSLRAMLSRYTLGADEARRCQALADAFQDLAHLANEGMSHTEKMLDALSLRRGAAEVRAILERMSDVDERIRVFGEMYGGCKPLVVLIRFERENLEGLEALRLAQETYQLYSDLALRAETTRRKLERVMALRGVS